MLRIEDGRVSLAMERAPLATGAVLDELAVELPYVEFPFDFREGIERFRHHRGLAQSASVSMEARLLLDWIHRLSDGTVSGRIQSLSMYRDFDSKGGLNGANSTIGIVLGYTTPEFAGFDAGLAYNYAGEIHQKERTRKEERKV